MKPSSIPKGIRLKNPTKAFIHAPTRKMSAQAVLDKSDARRMKKNAKNMFVNGPARAVLPIFFMFAAPAIKTAPGDISLKGIRRIDIMVSKTPNNNKRNSAHNP